jgi:hypothetical protein
MSLRAEKDWKRREFASFRSLREGASEAGAATSQVIVRAEDKPRPTP